MRIKKWMLAFCLSGWLFGWTAAALASEGSDVYKQTCAICHSAGMPGAPRLGNRADWQPRLLAGRPALLHSVLNGHKAMPPKGGNASLSDAQAEAALDYMLSKVAPPSFTEK